MSTDGQPGDLITVDDALDALGISRATLYRALKANDVPRYKRIGDRKTYVSRSEVAALFGFREIRTPYG
ncbi:MAG: helix-turn-helix transcriptional regulator [Tepidiformaceae bacterium]